MMRLDKFLAHAGCGTRKDVKKYIHLGVVLVNDVPVRKIDMSVDEVNDKISINGKTIEYINKIYIMINKPDGVISASTDSSQETVVDLVPEYKHLGIFPIGRLDKDTVGLLILSNDGDLAHRLLSPTKHVEKEYYVEVNHPIDDKLVNYFAYGVVLEDGYKSKGAKLFEINKNKCHVILTEGKYHQIKRMFKMFDYEVTFLERIRFKNIILDSKLNRGEYRLLSSSEIGGLIE